MTLTKFLTWTLHAPSNTTFTAWKNIPSTDPWYSKNYVDVDPNAINTWDYRKKGFINQFQLNNQKMFSIGMHEVDLDGSGNLLDTHTGNKVLSADESDLDYPVYRSLRYLMWTYPDIKWSLQVMATNAVVNTYLDTPSVVDEFIRQYKKVLQIYLSHGFPIKGAEVDFEKTTTRSGDDVKFANILSRIKNEVCIPLGLELRVNLLAMTGDYIPSYYGWVNYKTVAAARDMNGNQAVDEFQIMSYDFAWSGSAPGPSTPLNWLTSILVNVQKSLPPEKTFIGTAGYGNRWPLWNSKGGVSLDYKQLMLLQNGMYIHNGGDTSPDGNFYFNDQDFIPFCGFEDSSSGYAIALPHVYEKFKAQGGVVDLYSGSPSVDVPTGQDFVTNYSTVQHPLFTGLRCVLNSGTLAGNTADIHYSATLSENLPQPYTFNFYTLKPKRWSYDGNAQACIIDPTSAGVDGTQTFTFNLPAGSYRLVAFVGFPYFGNDHFDIDVNGTIYTIGNGIPDWYPFITNPSVHLYDCGQWNLNDSNTITVHQTNSAWIGGFIVCDAFYSDIRGGSISYPANLQVLKKRGAEDANGVSAIVDAQFPANMTITGEVLRRIPRPAIIWEDYFGPYLNGTGFVAGSSDLTLFPSYQQADEFGYTAGSGSTQITKNSTQVCVDGYHSVGFSQGKWVVEAATGNDAAHTFCDTTVGAVTSAQLVLNKKFSCNISCEADIQLMKDMPCRVGLRLLAQNLGEVGDSYLFLLDWTDNTVKLMHEVQGVGDVIVSNPMTDTLKSLKMQKVTLKARLIGNVLTCYVGNNIYLDHINLPYQKGPGAFGVYMSYTAMRVYRLTIATLDRYEPMEAVTVQVDGTNYPFGRVSRNVNTDEYGLLMYTGEPESIVSTETTAQTWGLDYKNAQLATLPSWVGKKDIRIIFNDPGVWLRNLYVGDSQGFSVSYNADKIAFIKTIDLIRNYGCAGIAMWTLGQEDPMVFDYIENVR